MSKRERERGRGARETERGGGGELEGERKECIREYPGVDITSTAAFLLLYCCVPCTLLPGASSAHSGVSSQALVGMNLYICYKKYVHS